jgi:TolA-binding protein
MTENVAPPAARRPYPAPYVMMWVLLASFSLAYLALLTIEPGLLTQLLGSPTMSASPQSNQGQRAMTDAGAEIKALRESVGQVMGEIEELKAQASDRAEREKSLTARLAALETSPADTAPGTDVRQAKSEPASAATEQGALVPGGTILLTARKPQATAPPDAAPDKVTAATTGTPLETGSVRKAAPSAAKPAPASAGGSNKPVGLHIATGPSVDSLRLSWALLSDRHGDSLGALEPRYVAGTDASGPTYDLVVGPISSAAEAKRMCKELGEKGTSCRVGDYTGDAL